MQLEVASGRCRQSMRLSKREGKSAMAVMACSGGATAQGMLSA